MLINKKNVKPLLFTELDELATIEDETLLIIQSEVLEKLAMIHLLDYILEVSDQNIDDRIKKYTNANYDELNLLARDIVDILVDTEKKKEQCKLELTEIQNLLNLEGE